MRDFLDFDPSIPIDAAPTPAKRWYLDPAVHDREFERVFAPNWQPVCRVDQVGEPGAFVAGSLLDNPYVVVRGQDGQLRAFHNVCAHHAAEVVDGVGRAEQLRCGYHGWTYRLDGTLCRVPGAGRLAGFDRQRLGLKPMGTATFGPFVCVRLTDPHTDADADLAEARTLLLPYLGPSAMTDLVWVERRAYELRCNWKVFVENSLDGGYHVPYVHPRLSSGLALDRYTTHIGSRTSVQVCAASGAQDRLGEQVAYGWLYPNMFFNRYGGMLDTNIVVPLTHDTCEVVFDWFRDPGADLSSADVAEAIAESDEVQRQDVKVCESVQRGMRSIAYDRGRYAPAFETAVHAFHTLLAKDLA